MITPGGLWDSNKLEIWGQWLLGEKVSEKFGLTYAGSPSQFEGGTTIPEGINEVKLQVLAADPVGNFGQYTLPLHISP
jgi:hypothetical protein